MISARMYCMEVGFMLIYAYPRMYLMLTIIFFFHIMRCYFADVYVNNTQNSEYIMTDCLNNALLEKIFWFV